MRFRFLPFPLLVVLLAGPRLEAQTFDLRGVVVDSATGEPIPFATVNIPSLKRGASTNADGFYLIGGLTHGRIEVVVTAVGFQRRVKTFAVQNVPMVTLNFQLSSKPVVIGEVISEAPTRRTESEGLTSLHVVTPSELDAVPMVGQNDILRALQILPGVVSSADVSSKLYVRGGAGDQNLILLDGIKIYNPYHALGVFSIFDPDIISSTEMYTGAFPAGYGGRLSSVLNMHTRAGNSTRVAGNVVIDPLASRLQIEGPIGEQITWLVSGRMSLLNEPYQRLLRQDVPASFYDLFLKGSHRSPELGRISVEGFLSGDDVSSPDPAEPALKWRNQAMSLSVAGLVGERTYATASAYGSSFHVTQDARSSASALPAESGLEEIGIRGELNIYTSTRHMYFGGFDVGATTFNNRIVSRSNITRQSSEVNPEAYLWFRARLVVEDWTFDAGLHFDGITTIRRGFTLGALEPRLTISYQLDNAWRASAAYGVFTQHTITLTSEDDITPLFEAWMPVPEELDPEEARHYVVGVEGNLLASLSVNLQGYYKSYTSLAMFNRDKVFTNDPDFVRGTGSSYGAEALVRWGIPFADLYLGYSLSWATVDVLSRSYPPRYDRRHSLSTLVVVHPWTGFDCSVRWEFGSGFPYSQTVGFYDRMPLDNVGKPDFVGATGEQYPTLGPKNAARLPAYHRLDLSANYRFVVTPFTATIGLNLMNMYDRHNILAFDRLTRERIDMVPFYPSVRLKVEF